MVGWRGSPRNGAVGAAIGGAVGRGGESHRAEAQPTLLSVRWEPKLLSVRSARAIGATPTPIGATPTPIGATPTLIDQTVAPPHQTVAPPHQTVAPPPTPIGATPARIGAVCGGFRWYTAETATNGRGASAGTPTYIV